MYNCQVENKKLINRINRISGQVNALKDKLAKDVECDKDEKDPYEVIRQLTAIKGAVNGMINSYVEHFAKGHLVEEIRNSKDTAEAMAQMDSLVDIMKTFSK
ncbi:MAG: metal-sensing transcriptional repressor [Campylobacterales bacterium]|nr:metal-sensing transcriptional repressor [Campylobacterales bacterium]